MLIALLLLLSQLALPPGLTQLQKPPPLLVVSIDGLPWPTWNAHQDLTPTLTSLARTGVQAPLQSVFPSLTWPTHATFMTGVLPAQHRVVGNHVLLPGQSLPVDVCNLPMDQAIAAPTLYDVAHAQGLKTAAILWPSTADARTLDWQIPEVYGQDNFAAHTTPAFWQELKTAGLPVADLGRIGNEEGFLLDNFSTEAAILALNLHRPDVLFVHLLAVDTYSHTYGPGAHPPLWGLRHADQRLTDLLAAYTQLGLRQTLNIVVLSDHGFVQLNRNSDPRKLIPHRLKAKIHAVANGQSLFVYAPDLKPGDWPPLLEAWRAHPDVQEVVTESQFAQRGLPLPTDEPRMPQVIVVAKPEVLWSRRAGLPAPCGMHGGNPQTPEMQGLLIASGPQVLTGRLPLLEAPQVAPLLAKLLHLAWPQTAGSLPPGVLR